MGNCTGSDSEDGALSNGGSEHKLSVGDESNSNVRPKPDFETRWKDDILAIWSRDISKLPVHTDVPRLSKKITVKSDAGDYIFDGTDPKYKTTPNGAITKMLLLAFAKAVDDKDLRNGLKKWDEFVPESGDTGEHLLSFFGSLTVESRDCPTLLVLKTIHQRIIFPAFYCLKDLLQRDMGKFKDKRGSWAVAIHISDQGSVKIVHKKRQQAVNVTANNHPEFEFDWDLELLIDLASKQMSKDIVITLSNLDVSADVPADANTKIQDAFKKYQTIK